MSFNFFKFQRKFFAMQNYRAATNPKVYFEISAGGKPLGKLVFELYSNHCPKTAANFLALCTGENAKKLSYKNNVFHRIIQGFMAQGGDITKGNGTGGESIYGRTFPDENLRLKHYKKGLLSMANSGPDTNGSQFFITFVECPWLNGNHCVFGEMIEGEEVLTVMESAGSRNGATKTEIKIIDCGEIKV